MSTAAKSKRFLLPLTFFVAGATWVVVAEYLFADVPDRGPLELLRRSSLGVLLVLLAAGLLHAVQVLPVSERVVPRAWRDLPNRPARALLMFLVATIGVALAGYGMYRQQASELRQHTVDILAADAGQHARQVESWVADREGALELTVRNPMVVDELVAALGEGDRQSMQRLAAGLDLLEQRGGFDRIALVDPAGNVLVRSSGDLVPDPRMPAWMAAARATGRAVIADVEGGVDPRAPRADISFVVGVVDPMRPEFPVGYLVAQVRVESLLRPLLLAKPPGHAARAMLVRRSGDGYLALPIEPGRNAFEYRAAGEPVMAETLRGNVGLLHTRDAAGTALLAFGRPIAGSPWHMVSTTVEADLVAPVRRLTLLVAALCLAALATTAGLVGFWWRSERGEFALRLAEAERRETLLKEHFLLAGRFAHDIVLLLECASGQIIEANDRAVEAFGYTREELLQMRVADLRLPGSPEAVHAFERFRRIHEAGSGQLSSRYWRKDGSSFPVEISGRTFEIDGRRLVQTLTRDVTERVEHEERLAAIASERDQLLRRMQLLFDRMPSACLIVSTDATILQVNPAFERLFGRAAEAAVGRPVGQYVRSRTLHAEAIARRDFLLGAADAIDLGVHEVDGADGRVLACHWNAALLRAADGSVHGIVVIADDITERVAAERALRVSEEHHRTLTELARVGILRLDPEGRVVSVNPQACEISGATPEQLLGNGWTSVVHAADEPNVDRAWATYRQGPDAGLHANQFRVRTADARRVWLMAQIAPEKDADGRLEGYVAVITDITPLKLAQQQLQRAHDDLERRVAERTRQLEAAKDAAEHSDRVKTTFLSTVSHELRTPLNAIIGFTDVVLGGLSGPVNEQQQKQLGIVRQSANGLRALIEDLLDVSRIEAGQVGLELDHFDVAELIVQRVEAFGEDARRRSIDLHMTVGADAPVRIRSDCRRVGQVIDNLVANALKFTPQGSVAIELRTHADRVEIVVVDTGIGIPAGALTTLFNPFTQVRRPGGRLREGTGLGLAIARNLARALGGDVTVSSVVDRGSRFTLWLPLVRNSTSGTWPRLPPLIPEATSSAA